MKYLTATLLYLLGIAVPVGIGALLTIWFSNADTKEDAHGKDCVK